MRIKVLSGGRKSIELPLSDAELNFQMKRIGIEEIVPVCRLVEASEKDNPLCKFEGQTVKMDEVNFFAKRLDCFTEYERKVLYFYVTDYGVGTMQDLINLTFSMKGLSLMPQKGTKTALYIGNGDEAQGIATGCIRTNGSTCEGTGSPEKKSFRSEHGKGMDLYPQRMGLDGGETGKITFEDETGTTIESNGGLVLMAKEGIRLESMTGIAMQGMSDIMALYAEGASSLCVNGSVDMLGRLAGISASKYTGYPPYDDAPKEGEFDWEGFTRNLAIGLGVVAVCAIGAAISIATLGAGSILAGAFIGAGIGALSTTAMKAGEEISNGNVRSAKEAFRDVGISAASGFITGAFGAKFPGAHRLVEGAVDTAVSAGERLAYAVFDDSMSWDEKWAYAFDPGQMVADFVTGVVIGEILDGIMAATQNKLRSIFANSDEMRRALDSGNKTKPYANSRPSFRKGVVEEVSFEWKT